MVTISPPTYEEKPMPDYFQQHDVGYVYSLIRSGESCSLVGIGSVGKSNLMAFMTRDDVRKRYLGDLAPYTLMVLLDPHKLINLHGQALEQAGGLWPGYEIMLSRLRRVIIEADDTGQLPSDNPDLVNQVESYYLNLFDGPLFTIQSGIRHLEEAVYQVMSMDKRWKIAFMFDEMEQFMPLPPAFFQSLRGLRDEFKQRVMFITASRRPLEELADEAVAISGNEKDKEMLESFLELFHGFRRYIGALDRPSAEWMVQGRLELRYGREPRYRGRIPLSPKQREELLMVTGQHAGLLRRSFIPMVTFNAQSYTYDQLFNYLLDNPGVLQECKTIYDSLSPGEQKCLQEFVHTTQYNPSDDCWKSLAEKELVTLTAGKPTLRLPILAGFIMKNKPR
jgi:hypothetical protein